MKTQKSGEKKEDWLRTWVSTTMSSTRNKVVVSSLGFLFALNIQDF